MFINWHIGSESEGTTLSYKDVYCDEYKAGVTMESLRLAPFLRRKTIP